MGNFIFGGGSKSLNKGGLLTCRGRKALPLSFTLQPQAKTVDEYALATFSCEVTGGVAPYTYQWKKNGTNVGTNSANLSFTAAATDKNASITVVVTDSAGAVITSTSAALSVMRNVVTFNGTTQAMDAPRVTGIDLDNLNCEIEIRCNTSSSGTIISQNLNNSSSEREFVIQADSGIGAITFILGGTATSVTTPLGLAAWSFKFNGGSVFIYKDGLLQSSTSVSVGIKREPTATIVVGARHDSSLSSYAYKLPSKIYHAKIWTGGDRNTGALVREYRMNDGFANNPVCVNSGTAGASGNGTYIGLTSGSWSREVAS